MQFFRTTWSVCEVRGRGGGGGSIFTILPDTLNVQLNDIL